MTNGKEIEKFLLESKIKIEDLWKDKIKIFNMDKIKEKIEDNWKNQIKKKTREK